MPTPAEVPADPEVGGPYARYVLGVLVVVYVFNFLDRQILSILAERIKADLHVTDAQIGFLYGTAFAVFYAVFGIPLGRLADVWDRRKLIALGLAFWSVMTAVSGLARSFAQLAAARIGVGIGEASAIAGRVLVPVRLVPARIAAPPRSRSTRAASTSARGSASSSAGSIVERWDAAFAGTTRAVRPARLAGRLSRRRPARPAPRRCGWRRCASRCAARARGCRTPPDPRPFRAFLHELRAVVPPFTVLHLDRTGAGARAAGREPRRRRAWPSPPPPADARPRHPAQWAPSASAVRGRSPGCRRSAGATRPRRRSSSARRRSCWRPWASPRSPSPATASASGWRRSSSACTDVDAARVGLLVGGAAAAAAGSA